jgi:hypothetical protein
MPNRINGFSVAGAVGFADGVDASIVTSSEQIIDSIFIPGGTFRAGDVILIQAVLIRSTTTTSNMFNRIYWNETPDITTTPTVLGVSSGSTNDEYIPIYRNVCIVSNTSTIVVNTVASSETDLGDNSGDEGGSAISTITSINWDLDAYIIVAGQNTSSTTITKKFLTIIK